MKTKNFILGLIPCIYACQNSNGSSEGIRGEEKEDWTSEEDEKLKQLVQEHGKDFEKIAAEIGTHSGWDCFVRWRLLQTEDLIRTGAITENSDSDTQSQPVSETWTAEEDALLTQHVEVNGAKNWHIIAEQLNRPAERCKQRWFCYVCRYSKFYPWRKEEDQLLVKKVKELGHKWNMIAQFFQRRTASACKSRWYGIRHNMKEVKQVPQKFIKYGSKEEEEILTENKNSGKPYIGISSLLAERAPETCGYRGNYVQKHQLTSPGDIGPASINQAAEDKSSFLTVSFLENLENFLNHKADDPSNEQ